MTVSKKLLRSVSCESCDSSYEVSYHQGDVMDRPGRQTHCFFCGDVIDDNEEYIEEDKDDDAEDE